MSIQPVRLVPTTSLYADTVLKVWSHIASSLPSVALVSSKREYHLLHLSGSLSAVQSYYSDKKHIVRSLQSELTSIFNNKKSMWDSQHPHQPNLNRFTHLSEPIIRLLQIKKVPLSRFNKENITIFDCHSLALAKHFHQQQKLVSISENFHIESWQVKIPIEVMQFFHDNNISMKQKDDNGNSLIHLVSDIDGIKKLQELGLDINAKNRAGDTPILCQLKAFSFTEKNLSFIKDFEQLGANLNAKNNKGQNLLYTAYIQGNIKIIQYLESKNIKLAGLSKLEQLIHTAKIDDIKKHFEVNQIAFIRNHNLYWAFNNKDAAVVKYIITKINFIELDLNLLCKLTVNNQEKFKFALTTLEKMNKGSRIDIQFFILSSIQSIEQAQIISQKYSIKKLNLYANIGTIKNNKMLEFMLHNSTSSKPSENYYSSKYKSFIFTNRTFSEAKYYSIERINLLLKYKVPPIYLITFLFKAITNDDAKAIKVLLDYGVKFPLDNLYNFIEYILSDEQKNNFVTNAIKHKIDIKSCPQLNHLIIGSLNINFIKLCNQSGIFHKSRYDQTKLHHFCFIHNNKFIKEILQLKQTKINAQNYFGNSPLHEAAFSNNLEAVTLLIKAGAKQDIKNKKGKLASQLSSNKKIIKLTEGDLNNVVNRVIREDKKQKSYGKIR